MANVKISDLAPAQLPLDTANTLFEVQTVEAGIPVSRKITADDLTVQGTITVEDEGTPLATGADTLNFTGAGVTASGTGSTKTIDIPGGGGAGSLQDAYDGGNTILIDGVPNPVRLDASVSGEMFEAYDTSANLIFQVLDVGVIAGNPGLEGAGILINGVLEDSVFKASDIGSANRPQVILHRHSSTDPSVMVTARAQGNGTGHTILSTDDPIFLLQNTGWDGASYAISSEIEFRVDGTPALDDMPGLIAFRTTPAGAEVSTERVRIREFGLTEFDVAIDFLERNAAVTGPTAGRAQLWVRDDTPNVLIFTDDTGSDFVLNAGAAPGGANTQIQYNDSGNFGGDAGLTWSNFQGQLVLTHDQPGGSGRDCFIINVDRPSSSAIVITTNEVGPGNIIMDMEADTGATGGFRLETSWFGADSDHFMRFVNGLNQDRLLLRYDGLAQMGGVTFDAPNTTIEVGAQVMEFTERAAPNPAAATIGQLFVRNDTPNVLVFRDDAGTDFVLNGGGGSPGGANTAVQFNNGGAFGGSPDFEWNGSQLKIEASQAQLFLDETDGGGAAQLFLTSTTTADSALVIEFDSSTGVDARIRQATSGGTLQDTWITFREDQGVGLRYNDVQKLATLAEGILSNDSIYIIEKASANADTATRGQLWMETRPFAQRLMFTPENGADIIVAGLPDSDVSPGSNLISGTSFVAVANIGNVTDTVYMLLINVEVTAPAADDMLIQLTVNTGSRFKGVLTYAGQGITAGSSEIESTTGEVITNNVLVPTSGNSTPDGTYVSIQGVLYADSVAQTVSLRCAKNADTGADGFAIRAVIKALPCSDP